MWLMLQQSEPNDYPIASGQTHSVQELVELAFGCVGLSWRDHVVIKEDLFRPAEVDILVGDASKAKEGIGWSPKTNFEELVELMVKADIDELSSKR